MWPLSCFWPFSRIFSLRKEEEKKNFYVQRAWENEEERSSENCVSFILYRYRMSVCESIQWTHPLYVCMSTPLPVSCLIQFFFFSSGIFCLSRVTNRRRWKSFFFHNFIFISAKAAAFSQPYSHHLPDICEIVVYTNNWLRCIFPRRNG